MEERREEEGGEGRRGLLEFRPNRQPRPNDVRGEHFFHHSWINLDWRLSRVHRPLSLSLRPILVGGGGGGAKRPYNGVWSWGRGEKLGGLIV